MTTRSVMTTRSMMNQIILAIVVSFTAGLSMGYLLWG